MTEHEQAPSVPAEQALGTAPCSPLAPSSPPRLLTPSGSVRRRFPKPAAFTLPLGLAIAIVGARLAGPPGAVARGLGAVVATLSVCSMATWLEQRVYDKLLGKSRLKRIVLSLLLPLGALVLGPFVGGLVGLLGLLFHDNGAFVLSLVFGSFWLASAAVGSIVIVLIDVAVSAVIRDFRSRVQTAVLSLTTLGILSAVGIYAAARAIGEGLQRAAAEGKLPAGMRLDLGEGALDPAQSRLLLGQAETAELATIFFLMIAVLMTLPAMLSACGKLADAVMERLNPLRAAFDEVGAGRLDVRVEEAGSRELQAIGRGFNRMTESLSATLSDLERRNLDLAEMNRATVRFVPFQFLELLRKSSIREIERGDQIELEISVLFSDIRGFTTMAEGMGAKATFGFINRYFGHMEAAIHRQEGFINDIYGDGIMALFHRGADAALRAALGMLEAVELFNQTLLAEGKAPIRVGIGMHSGTLMLGTIGGKDRLSCTVIGDPANTAARVEGMTKLYGARLLVSDGIERRLDDASRYRLRELDRVQAKGKREPLVLYEALDGEPGELGAAKWRSRERFAEGLRLFRQAAFAKAQPHFEACLAAAPADEPARLYVERCRRHLEHPPGPSWDGITRLDSK
jgi:class 3 adenylate cyclase/HAMP domain-containing protein